MDEKITPRDQGFLGPTATDTVVPDDPFTADVLEEGNDSEETTRDENIEYYEPIHMVYDKFARAKMGREPQDRISLQCYRNFRGLYDDTVKFMDTEKSQAFIKITKTKVLAGYSKITEVLFSSAKFPIGIEHTPVPLGIAEAVHFDPKAPKEEAMEPPQQPGTIMRKDVWERLGPLKEKLEPAKEDIELKEGPGLTKSSVTFEPAKAAARKMEMKIHDQLIETNADKHLRNFVFEMCLFGTGVMKGPLAMEKEYPRWSEKGAYDPLMKIVPDIESVSMWDCYPDPNSRTNIQDCDYFIQRHRMTKSQLRSLKKRPFFRSNSINLAIDQGANYVEEDWEQILKDNDHHDDPGMHRFEVLEYWGTLDRTDIEGTSFEDKLPKKYKDKDEINVNIWVCNNQLLRLVVNPFNPARIPYYACPYENNPYSFWGIGIAENMIDTQLLMNGFFRLAVDNGVLSSNMVFEVDETNLSPEQDWKVYPGKVFRRQGGAVGQAITGIKIPNVTQECMILFDKARQLSDEATGMPSYAHGMSGIMSTGRTAAGMSMLMGAADENIKSVVRNVDDYLLVPLGNGLFSFNMQYDFDPSIQGDLSVVAKGTDSLMRNEVRSQKLLQFLQITTNDADAPFVKRDYILKELAASLDLDPDKVVNDLKEAALQAATLKDNANAMGKTHPQLGTSAGGAQGLPGPNATNDGGTPGAAPMPQEQGFSGGTPANLQEVS